MPTARPIMLIMLTAKTETLKTWARTAVSATAIVMAISARTIGRPAATSVPKTSSRMTRAIGRPMLSPLLRSVVAVWLKSLLMLAVPVISDWKPFRPSAAWTIAWTLSMLSSALFRSPAMTMGMIAVWPSAEIICGTPP